jgi:hypothetical protein
VFKLGEANRGNFTSSNTNAGEILALGDTHVRIRVRVIVKLPFLRGTVVGLVVGIIIVPSPWFLAFRSLLRVFNKAARDIVTPSVATFAPNDGFAVPIPIAAVITIVPVIVIAAGCDYRNLPGVYRG